MHIYVYDLPFRKHCIAPIFSLRWTSPPILRLPHQRHLYHSSVCYLMAHLTSEFLEDEQISLNLGVYSVKRIQQRTFLVLKRTPVTLPDSILLSAAFRTFEFAVSAKSPLFHVHIYLILVLLIKINYIVLFTRCLPLHQEEWMKFLDD